ncbi:outer dense fiber protein 2-like isoform X7 [Pecten maximus]|uniref:outer dense fiber protein 2-like isoform X7 n=1 Tax=Pecten maximus TaxID=6579 RepID=UPI0014582BA4|nr:outer dense fiber protein 2-like isoform X7 [Pecten maximus]
MGKRGMSADKGLRPTSPVHVHVDDDVPVHVHVKQKGKLKTRKVPSVGGPVRSALSKKSTARSKSPGGAWVPPPGKATKGSKVTWQGPTHRLEISNPRESLRMSDLDTDEEEQVHGQMRNYEKKIEGLMSEVGTLKNEAELQKTLKEIVHKDDLLDASRHVMREQERELDDYKDELDITAHENHILRRSMENLTDEAVFSRHEAVIASGEREKLMKKLIEVEMDGQSAVKHVGELRDVIRRLREENKLSHGDSVRYGRQKDILLEKLADFEATNRTLRRLLREQHHAEAAALRLGEQRDDLVIKLSDSERQNERLRIELMDRDRLIGDMRANISAQKEENIALTGLQSTLESTRAHLQKQLRTKEADCNRMAVQIRTIDGSKAQDKIEIEHLTELLANAKEKAERDKEALKKATRVQKQRALRSEDALEQLNTQLMERESQLEDLRTQLDQMGPRYDKLSKEKSQILAENSALSTSGVKRDGTKRLGELETLMDRVENNTKIHQENTTAELQDKQGQVSVLKIENERLKTSITTIEEKFRAADEELVQLRGNLKHYENLVEEYKSQGVSISKLPPPTVSKVTVSTPLMTSDNPQQSMPSATPAYTSASGPVSEGGAPYYPISQQHPGQVISQPQGGGASHYSHPGTQTSVVGGGIFQPQPGTNIGQGLGGGYYSQPPSGIGPQSAVYGYEGMGQHPQVSVYVHNGMVSHC